MNGKTIQSVGRCGIEPPEKSLLDSSLETHVYNWSWLYLLNPK
jgi:hypothetical protein